MNYEKAYKDLRLEIIPVVTAYRTFIATNTEFEYLKTYTDAMAQVETLEKLEAIIKQHEDEQ